MKKIAEIVKSIKGELKGAEEYATLSAKYKVEDRDLASTYSGLATTELSHVDSLHSQVVRIIKEHKASGKEVPPAMQKVWDWEHEQIMQEYAEVKAMLDMAKK